MRETLDELEASAKRFYTIEEFVGFIDEVARKRKSWDQRHKDADDDKISLMTIHKSKGQEFPVVILIGACEGNMPHSSVFESGRINDIHILKT